MLWAAGVFVVALALGQIRAEELENGVVPEYVGPAVAKNGLSGPSSRIVSGWEAEPGQFPYQVLLRSMGVDGLIYGCGGSIIAKNWVLSAAHCTSAIQYVMVNAGMIDARAPVYQFVSYNYTNHPTFDSSRPSVVQPNDISIIRVDNPFVYSDTLQRIRIQPSADAFRNYNNEVVVASGWGRLWTNGAQPDILNWVYLRATSNLDCSWIYGSQLITDNAICARFYNVTSQSTCNGDSGGPLVHTSADGEPILIGIASFVAGGDFGCHSEHPAGFIRPGPFLSWLNEITGLDLENLDEDEPTTTAAPTTTPPTTTQLTTTTTKAPEPDSEEDSSSSESIEDPEIEDLLKKLIIKVKVKVKINDEVKRKLKLMSEDNFK